MRILNAKGSAAVAEDVLALLEENPDEAADLDCATIANLLAQGVDALAIGSPWCVRRAYVSFQPWGDSYLPLCTGEPALIFGIFDRGLIDLAAWWPAGGKIGTRLGIGACLGQGQIGRDGLGMADRPIPVFRNPVTWLRQNRRGLVVADWDAAAHLLSDVALRPEDERHGIELSRRLRVRPPIIVSRMRLAA
jgi:hypothetical protein